MVGFEPHDLVDVIHARYQAAPHPEPSKISLLLCFLQAMFRSSLGIA